MTSNNISFKFIRWCAVFGTILLLIAEFAKAQGFQQGNAAIGQNPFSEPVGNDDDDDSSDQDFQDFTPPSGGTRPGQAVNSARPNNTAPTKNPSFSFGGKPDSAGPQITKTANGYDVSGPDTDKSVIAGAGQPAPLTIDNESGAGSNEIITDFNFPKADILDLAKAMGRITGKNFIVDEGVKGTVTIISNSSITIGDAWKAFLTALDINKLSVVPSGKYLRIMNQDSAKSKQVRLYSDKEPPDSDALVTKIFKVRHINAKDLETPIRSFVNQTARIFAHEQTNTLMITDTASNIARVGKILDFIDISGFDAAIEVIPVKWGSASDIAKLIDTLLPGQQQQQSGYRPGGFNQRQTGFTARRTKDGGFVNAIIADDRTNSLIVHANPQGFKEVKALVDRLDRKTPPSVGGGKVHVIYLQFGDAEELAKTLTSLNQQTSTPQSNPGFNPLGAPGLGVNPTSQNLFEGQIHVAADKSTNSLVITASPADFVILQRVINKLDVPRDQVFVEIVVLEMDVSHDAEYAANVLLPKGTAVAPTADLVNLLQNPAAIPTGLVLHWASSSGSNINVPTANNGTQSVFIPNLAGLIKAIQKNTNANILMRPQLMTLDNVQAVFDSTQQIPTPTTTTNLGNSVTSITYTSVPLTVKVKPQINKTSDFVKLELDATLGDILNSAASVPAAVQQQAFATLTRKVTTTVVVADQDTVVLGGLVRDKSQEEIDKVPLLGDIPILGWLFKARTATTEKVNLELFITPKIVRPYERVRAIMDEKLKERDRMVEKDFGGEDVERDARDNMIRSLPNVKGLNYKVTAPVESDGEQSYYGNEPAQKPEKKEETLELPAPEENKQ